MVLEDAHERVALLALTIRNADTMAKLFSSAQGGLQMYIL